MSPAPNPRSTSASRLLLAVLAGCALLLTATPTASAAPDPPSITLADSQISGPTNGDCTYDTLWSVTDAKGRFVWIRVEYRIGPNFVPSGSVQLDLKNDPTAAFRQTVSRTQLEVRTTLIKNNGTQIAQSEPALLVCPSGA